jgi:hypothetical protein
MDYKEDYKDCYCYHQFMERCDSHTRPDTTTILWCMELFFLCTYVRDWLVRNLNISISV